MLKAILLMYHTSVSEGFEGKILAVFPYFVSSISLSISLQELSLMCLSPCTCGVMIFFFAPLTVHIPLLDTHARYTTPSGPQLFSQKSVLSSANAGAARVLGLRGLRLYSKDPTSYFIQASLMTSINDNLFTIC